MVHSAASHCIAYITYPTSDHVHYITLIIAPVISLTI